MKAPSGNGGEKSLATMEGGIARIGEEMEKAMDRFWRSAWESPFSLLTDVMPWVSSKALWEEWPAVDIVEEENAIVIRADVPGLDAKDITVEVADKILTIRGSREEEQSEKKANVTCHERRFGKFERSIELPTAVDADKVQAKYEKGTLTISVPRIAGEGPRRVEVKSA